MNDTKLTIETFTVSWSLGGYKGSEKSDSFVSATVRCDPPAKLEDFSLLRIKVALQIAASVIQDAASRQTMTEDEARIRIQEIKENYQSLEQAIIFKGKTNENT